MGLNVSLTEFDYTKHFLAGFVLFNKNHKPMFDDLKKFYFDNHESILNHEDKLVKRGRDQPVLNYFIQINKIDTKVFPISHGVNDWGMTVTHSPLLGLKRI